MKKDTRIHLPEEIEKLLRSNAIHLTPGIERILLEARAGEFHDYKNEKYAFGKIAVVELLNQEGLIDLAKRVMDGEFDEEADADDLKRMRADIIANTKNKSEANAMIKIFKLGDPV